MNHPNRRADDYRPALPLRWGERFTLLLTGPNAGVVGAYGATWPGQPAEYERVNVIVEGSDTTAAQPLDLDSLRGYMPTNSGAMMDAETGVDDSGQDTVYFRKDDVHTLIAQARAARPSTLTDAQIAAGAAVIGDDGKPIGRNTAIMVADTMAGMLTPHDGTHELYSTPPAPVQKASKSPSRAALIECALRSIIEADDNQALAQQLIEVGRAALATPAQPAGAADTTVSASENDLPCEGLHDYQVSNVTTGRQNCTLCGKEWEGRATLAPVVAQPEDLKREAAKIAIHLDAMKSNEHYRERVFNQIVQLDAQAGMHRFAPVGAQQAAGIDMVLYCPKCGQQHIDAPEYEDDPTMIAAGITHKAYDGWTNPPHRSHLCHGCGHIWRPADVPTNGVRTITSKGKNDSPVIVQQAAAKAPAGQQGAWVAVKDQLPQVGELVLVYSPPTKHDYPDTVNIGFDCMDPDSDDGTWLSHNEHYEHWCCVAKPEGSIGPSADAPYTHWMPLPLPPEQSSTAGAAKGGNTFSNSPEFEGISGSDLAAKAPAAQAVDAVTLDSALAAIGHINAYNGPGRRAEAFAMLVTATPASTPEASQQAAAVAAPIAPEFLESAALCIENRDAGLPGDRRAMVAKLRELAQRSRAATAAAATTSEDIQSSADARDAARYRILRQNVRPADINLAMTRKPPTGLSSAEHIDFLCDLYFERRAAMRATQQEGGNTPDAVDAALADAVVNGTGAFRVNGDGSTEHVDMRPDALYQDYAVPNKDPAA